MSIYAPPWLSKVSERLLSKQYQCQSGWTHIEGSRPEWCILSMIHSSETTFWSGTLDIVPDHRRNVCHLPPPLLFPPGNQATDTKMNTNHLTSWQHMYHQRGIHLQKAHNMHSHEYRHNHMDTSKKHIHTKTYMWLCTCTCMNTNTCRHVQACAHTNPHRRRYPRHAIITMPTNNCPHPHAHKNKPTD